MRRRVQSNFRESKGEGTLVGVWGGAHNTRSTAEDQAVRLDPTVAVERAAVVEGRSASASHRRLQWVHFLDSKWPSLFSAAWSGTPEIAS
jgi:hypothetical protein